MTIRSALRTATLLLLTGALAGCSRGGEGEAVSVRDQAEPIYRELAQCIRENGYPGFPDPVVNDDGTVVLPEDVERVLAQREATLRAACEDVVERLPPSVLDGGDAAQVTPEKIEERKRFARCVRSNGVPDFPDPNAAGEIMLSNQPNRGAGLHPAAMRAFEACGLRGEQGAELKRGLDELGVR